MSDRGAPKLGTSSGVKECLGLSREVRIVSFGAGHSGQVLEVCYLLWLYVTAWWGSQEER